MLSRGTLTSYRSTIAGAQRRHSGVVFVVPLPVELPGDRIEGTDLG